MKKIYETPYMEVMNVCLSKMMAASVGVPNAAVDPTHEVGAGDVEARSSYDIWDDEGNTDENRY